MNWWLLAGGVMAMVCTAGHAVAGRNMFYLPIKSAIVGETQSAVFTGMWHLITINFALSGATLLVLGAGARHDIASWFVAAQFAGYALAYLVISLRLGSAFKLFQWMPFAATAMLAAAGALATH